MPMKALSSESSLPLSEEAASDDPKPLNLSQNYFGNVVAPVHVIDEYDEQTQEIHAHTKSLLESYKVRDWFQSEESKLLMVADQDSEKSPTAFLTAFLVTELSLKLGEIFVLHYFCNFHPKKQKPREPQYFSGVRRLVRSLMHQLIGIGADPPACRINGKEATQDLDADLEDLGNQIKGFKIPRKTTGGLGSYWRPKQLAIFIDCIDQYQDIDDATKRPEAELLLKCLAKLVSAPGPDWKSLKVLVTSSRNGNFKLDPKAWDTLEVPRNDAQIQGSFTLADWVNSRASLGYRHLEEKRLEEIRKRDA